MSKARQYLKCTAISFGILLGGCVSREVSPDSLKENRLFPIGVYEQKIRLETKSDQTNLNGILKIDQDEITFVVLSRLSSPVFRIRDNLLTRDITTEIFIEKLRRESTRLRNYYSVLRPLLLAPKSGKVQADLELVKGDDKGRPESYRSQNVLGELRISTYDNNSIPQVLEFSSNDTRVRIEVVSYKLGDRSQVR